MNLLIRLLINAFAVFILAHVLSGVSVDGYVGAIVVALVLAVLNFFVKPILVILTLPITLITLGLFLIIINAIIIYLADKLIDGFSVSSFLTALIFSILLSVVQYVLQLVFKDVKKG